MSRKNFDGPQHQYRHHQHQERRSTGEKFLYFGLGVTAGVVLSPIIKKGIETYKPDLDNLFKSFLGKAESGLENVTDIVAKVKNEFITRNESNQDPNKSSDSPAGKEPCRNTDCST